MPFSRQARIPRVRAPFQIGALLLRRHRIPGPLAPGIAGPVLRSRGANSQLCTTVDGQITESTGRFMRRKWTTLTLLFIRPGAEAIPAEIWRAAKVAKAGWSRKRARLFRVRPDS